MDILSPPSETEPSYEPSRHFWLAVLLLSMILGLNNIREHWEPNKWLYCDGAFYANITRGLLEKHSLRQDTLHPRSWYERDLGWNREVDAGWSNISLGRHQEWWPKHPLLMPLSAAPLVWALGPIGTLVFHFLCFCLIGVFAYGVASHLCSRPASLAAACAMVATPWFYERA